MGLDDVPMDVEVDAGTSLGWNELELELELELAWDICILGVME